MDEHDDRIRAALHDLTAPRDPAHVRDAVLTRLHVEPRPRSRAVIVHLRLAAAAVVSLAIAIAVTGGILVGRATPSPSPNGSPFATASGAPAGTADPQFGRVPEVHWTRLTLEVGAGTMGSVTRTASGVVAGGSLLDTSHHHNTATSEQHHLEAVVWTSPDGRNWRRVDAQPGFEHAVISAVAASSGMILAVGSGIDAAGDHPPRMWRSTDGTEWSIVSPEGLPAGATLGSLTPISAGFLLGVSRSAPGGEVGGSLWRSIDGLAWEEVILTDYVAVRQWSVFAVGAAYVAVGQRSAEAVGRAPLLMRSDDGATWDALSSADDAFGPDLISVDDIVAGGPGFTAAGRVIDTVSPQDPATTRLGPPTDGAIWTSTDLATWTRVEPGRELFGGVEDEAVSLVEPMAGGYVALGASGPNGAAWVTADGIAWHKTSAPLESFGAADLEDAAVVDGEIVVVGGSHDGQPGVWLGQATVVAQSLDLRNVDGLVAALQAGGASVAVNDPFDPAPADVLGRDGRHICVDGQRVLVYAFANREESTAFAAGIDRHDPSRVGNAIFEWAGDPRFWHSGSLIVLYLGPDPRTEHLLTSVLGPVLAKGGGRAADAQHFAC